MEQQIEHLKENELKHLQAGGNGNGDYNLRIPQVEILTLITTWY